MYIMAIIKIIYNPRNFCQCSSSSYYQWFRFIKILSLISSHILMSLDLNTSLAECWSGTKNFNIRLFVTKHVLVHVYRSCQDMDLLVEYIQLHVYCYQIFEYEFLTIFGYDTLPIAFKYYFTHAIHYRCLIDIVPETDRIVCRTASLRL